MWLLVTTRCFQFDCFLTGCRSGCYVQDTCIRCDDDCQPTNLRTDFPLARERERETRSMLRIILTVQNIEMERGLRYEIRPKKRSFWCQQRYIWLYPVFGYIVELYGWHSSSDTIHIHSGTFRKACKAHAYSEYTKSASPALVMALGSCGSYDCRKSVATRL